MNQLVMELLSQTSAGFETDGFTIDERAPSYQDNSASCGSPVVGVLWGLDEQGAPLVLFDEAHEGNPVPARSVVPLSRADVGRDAVLLFEQGDRARPLVMGILRISQSEPVRTEIDGEKLVFTSEREIVLRCGDASITLTRAGKILIQGAYVLSRSSGVNRIKGGSIQLN
jgi:hypothetical protein